MTSIDEPWMSWQQLECLDAVARQLLERGWVVRMPRTVPGEAGQLAVSASPFSTVVTVAVDADHQLVLHTSVGRSVTVLDVAQLHAALHARLRRPGRQQTLGRSA